MATQIHAFGPNGELSPGAEAALEGLGGGGGGHNHDGTYLPAAAVSEDAGNLLTLGSDDLVMLDPGDLPSGGGGLPEPGPGVITPALVLTFDDGTIGHYTHAFPEFQSRGKVGTFFVTATTVGTGPCISESQMLEMHAAGMEIGSHGYTGTTLGPEKSEAEVRAELSAAKNWFATRGIDARSHAYVGGFNSPLVRQIVGEYFDVARTTQWSPGSTQVHAPAAVLQSGDLDTNPTAALKTKMEDHLAAGWDCIITAHAIDSTLAAKVGELLDHADAIGMEVRTFIGAYDERVAYKYGTHGLTLGRDGGIGATVVHAEQIRASASLDFDGSLRLRRALSNAGPETIMEVKDTGTTVSIGTGSGRPLVLDGNQVRVPSTALHISGNQNHGMRFADFPGNGLRRPAGIEGLDILSQNTTQLQARHSDIDNDTGILIRVRKDGTAALSRVTIGDEDSGGMGYRVLRVPN